MQGKLTDRQQTFPNLVVAQLHLVSVLIFDFLKVQAPRVIFRRQGEIFK